MKKTRNSFFTEANMNYANFQNPGMMPQAANIPYQASTNYNSFYSGPGGMNNTPMTPVMDQSSIENRLAKIERQINRLDHRISKLENLNVSFLDNDIDTSGNMYMI